MPPYELKTVDSLPLLTISARDDASLEMDLIMFANVIAGAGGFSVVEKKADYWKIVYNRVKAKERFLIVKRKMEP